MITVLRKINKSAYFSVVAIALLSAPGTFAAWPLDLDALPNSGNDLATPKFTFEFPAPVNAVSFSRDGTRMGVLSNFGNVATIYDSNTEKRLASFRLYGAGYSGNSFALVSSGDFFTAPPVGAISNANVDLKIMPPVTSADGIATLRWRPGHSEVFKYYPVQPTKEKQAGNTFAVSEDAHLLATVVGFGKSVLLFDLNSGALLHTLSMDSAEKGEDNAVSLAISSSGEVVVGTQDGEVIVFNAKSGVRRTSFSAYDQNYSISGVAINSKGYIAVGGRKKFDGSLVNGKWFKWPTSLTPIEVWTPDGHLFSKPSNPAIAREPFNSAIYSLSWSPNGNNLAVGTGRELEIWELTATGLVLRENHSLARGCYSVAYSDKNELAVVSGNKVLIFHN